VGRCPKASGSIEYRVGSPYYEDESMTSYSADSRGNKKAVKNFKFHKADERLRELQ
jgi:hypothetical protein